MKIQLKIGKPAFIYILFSIIFMGVHIINISPLFANSMIAILGLSSLLYTFKNRGIKGINSYLVFLGIIYSMLMILSTLYNGNADYTNILWVWTYMGIATLTYEFYISSKVFWGVSYIINILLLIYIILGGNVHNVISRGSQNNISAYIIFFLAMAYLSVMKKRCSINYLPSFLVMGISAWSSSRAGILAGMFIIIATFIYNFLFIKGKKIKLLLRWIVLIIVSIWLVNNFFGQYLVDLTNKISRYGDQSVRTTIWIEYLCGMKNSIGNFLFGVKTTNSSYYWLSYYTGNTHNSFLMLHAKFGIAAIILLSILFIKVIKKGIKERNYIVIIVLFTISIRMFFDWIGFPGLYDIIFWYLVLYSFEVRFSKNKCRLEIIDE
ncbi:O-antigen ligase family protein [Clostridium perfringens]|uniref:O-antigen ligase family protein n=1 Tax=Clostridium perfringens TaxID=1502 RepID=UPI002246D26B|nr:hypothetical protein [Clostridium perfringens]MCX0414253.1 hypothetical protein [Clostridium perfringens]